MLNDQKTLIASLTRILTQDMVQPSLFETHISWVLVTKEYAYKIKKAVRFEFLDFSTLDLRHFYCEEELRLNARFSPELYLSVIAIVGTPEAPLIDAAGAAVEYAIKMRAFSQEGIWSARLQSGRLLPAEIDAFAHKLAKLHQDAPVAARHSPCGSSSAIASGAASNLVALSELIVERAQKEWVEKMRAWQDARQEELSATFESRKAHGWIRECHADLHCGNILTINGEVSVFDCIEFNESLRWIDVMDDIAFTCMDLDFQDRPDLAFRLLSRYLEVSGDYDGLSVHRYYQVEHALVRCKVALLRARQVHGKGEGSSPHMALATRYMAFSSEKIEPMPLVLVLMHGYSGSGKSFLASCLVEAIGAIQLRSDVERKRIHDRSIVSGKTDASAAGLYDLATTQMTYARLRQLAEHVIRSRLSVIVDAASLREEQRRQFVRLAQELSVPLFILDVQTGEATLKQRILARTRLGLDPSDADLATLSHQIATREDFSDDELKYVLKVNGETPWSTSTIGHITAPIMDALHHRSGQPAPGDRCDVQRRGPA